ASTGPRSIERGESVLILSAKDGLGKSRLRAPWPQAHLGQVLRTNVASKPLPDSELGRASAWRIFPTTKPLA
ncbi:MAG: hypothetical protein WCK27_16090, partial [Verrucomicrobiota bacterium]